jgi:Helix-turn-helix domain
MADVWESSLKDATLVAVLLCLANYADDDGTNSYPGTERISRMTRYSKRTVIRAIAELASEGWITVVERGLGQGNMSGYEIDVAKLKRCQAVTFEKSRRKVTRRPTKGDTGARKGDTGDNPPHPLFGRSVKEPSGEPLPPTPYRATTPTGKDRPSGTPGSRSQGEEELRLAVAQVCKATGVVDPRVAKLFRRVIAVKQEAGESPPLIAALMIRRWNRQAEMSEFLQAKLGPRKFFALGYWENENRWHWDEKKWRLHNEAKVGSFA